MLKNWYRIQVEPQIILEDIKINQLIKNKEDEQLIILACDLLKLQDNKLRLALLFLEEIIKLKKDIPQLAKQAIMTGNPFLFRSLFSDFREAETFAVGGKLNSSLETKYGNLFEKLMGAFGNCRRIYDGGVDVVIGQNAFDIKSGPSVMNKSMVDAFSAKQVLIQEKKILPNLNTYKIALGYGKREQLNSFMAKIDSEVLTAREAWSQITGVEHSPEIIFAIAGSIPRIFGVESLVSSFLGESESYFKNYSDDAEFKNLFNNSFYSIELKKEAQKEIASINSILNS